jgi:hypothetical protein
MTKAKRYPATRPIRIGITLKKPLKKIVATIATTRVKAAIERKTRLYCPFAPFIAIPIAVGARLRPMTMITEPMTTGGRTRSSQPMPTVLMIAATTQ